MVFHPCAHAQAKEAIKLFLAPRSLPILKGGARHDWAHSIPKTKWDMDTRGKWWSRTRGVPITVRGVNKVPAPTPATSTELDRSKQNPQKAATAADKTFPNETKPAPTYEEVLKRNLEPQTPAREPKERRGTLASQPEPRRKERNTGKEGKKEGREIGSSEGRQTTHQEEKDGRRGTGKVEGKKGPQPPPNPPRRIKGTEKGQGIHPQGKGKRNQTETPGTPHTHGSHWQEREVKGEIK